MTGSRDDEFASEAELAAFDADLGRTFGRGFGAPVPDAAVAASAPLPWRTGPAGEMTIEEYDLSSELDFGRMTGRLAGEREAELHRQCQETDRQLAIERQLIEQGPRVGWPAAARAAGVSVRVAESVRERAPAGGEPEPPKLSQREQDRKNLQESYAALYRLKYQLSEPGRPGR